MRYAIVFGGKVENVIILNDASDFDPGQGRQLIQTEEAGVGWTFNNGVFENPYEPEQPNPDSGELRRAEIVLALSQIDAESIRPAREVAAALVSGASAPAYAVQKIADLEKRAGDLRTELAGLQ